jgi:hypothetical protein
MALLALGPVRPAEEYPPDKDSQPAGHSANYCNQSGFGPDNRDDRPEQSLHDDDDDAGPQPEWLPTSWFFGLLGAIDGSYARHDPIVPCGSQKSEPGTISVPAAARSR